MFTHILCSGQLIQTDLILEDRFQQVIDQSLDFLIRRQKRDGSFIYDHYPFQGRTLYKGSWVRQAGTLLSMALAFDGKNQELKKSIKAAASFFKENSIAFERDGTRMRIISDNHEGYTGTICLFLTAYFHLHHIAPKDFPIDSSIYQELMDTLAYYHHEEEGLTRYINTKETYIEKHWRDSEIYASAQHFVLLAMYHKVFERTYLHPTLLSYLELYDRKWTYGELGPSYHWVMMGLNLLDDLQNPELHRRILRIAYKLQLAMDSEFPLDFQNNNYCARLEGFGSYLSLLQKRNLLDRRELYELTRHLRYSKNFQLQEHTKKKAALPSKSTQSATGNLLIAQKTPRHSSGGFWHKEVDGFHTRIDITQHCLSAYLYHDVIMERVPLKPWVPQEEWNDIPTQREISDKKLHPIILKTIFR